MNMFSCRTQLLGPQKISMQSGMTLIELLVSLVILGFVVTIMSGAFFQISQVVRIAETVNGQFQPKWVRLHALTDLVGNLVLPLNIEHPFQGDALGFEGYSLSLPQSDWGNVQQFRTKLANRDHGGMELTVLVGDEKPVVIASWDIPIKLEYLAADGSSQSMWPPFGKASNEMPMGVVVRASSGEQLVQMVAPYFGKRKPERSAADAVKNLFNLKPK